MRAMGRVGLDEAPCGRYAGAQVSGTAVTVSLLHPGDNWMMHVVAEQSGDIVVAAITAECTDSLLW